MNPQLMRPDQNFAGLIEATRKIAGEVAAQRAADVDARSRFPSETVEALRAAGVLSAAVP